MSTSEPAQRLLLVEDDPVSAAFLAAALGECGAVSHVATLAEAVETLCGGTVAAVICDCRLPDGHARDLPRRLQARGAALPPALALSAEVSPEDVAGLRAAGFGEVLGKPLAAGTLQAAVLALLGQRADLWDDAAADTALGLPPAQRQQLRQLLLQELPAQRERIAIAMQSKDFPALNAELHRLTASCGFCGAKALGAATAALRAGPDLAGWQAFDRTCAALLAAGTESP